jgi:prepilin-type N-terminal cleavage/methylation domain-containing protein
MRRDAGFTLIELLVAIAVLAIFIVGILSLFDTSQRVAKTETELADTQENVRYAAYHLLRTARMVGGTAMPFAHDDAGADVWVAGQLQNNVSTFVNDFDGSTVPTTPGSDVLTLRGFFETSPFFVNPTRSPTPDIDWSNSIVTIHEDVAGDQNMNVAAGELAGRGVVFMGRGQYAVSRVVTNTAPAGTAGARTFTISFEASPAAPWSTFNPGGIWAVPAFQVFRIGILDSYTYYVAPDFRLMRIRAGAPAPEPVAISIGNLQCVLGVDTNDPDVAVDTWVPAAGGVVTVADVSGDNTPMALGVTVLGRTAEPVMGWTEPAATFQGTDMPAGVPDRSAKWRRMQVTATLRDFVL